MSVIIPLLRKRTRSLLISSKCIIRTKSSTPNPRTPIYNWHEDVEEIEEYRSGGYHPVILDTIYQDRYRIVHKLGYGAYSTVWLARDEINQHYVSLKILTARASARSKEAQILHHLHQRNQNHPGRRLIMSCLDDFTLTGANGDHTCLVNEALGPNVADVKECFACDLLPLEVAKRITFQLALGISYVHSCGIIHGDLHMGNLAYRVPGFDSWSKGQVYEVLNFPNKQIVSRVDGGELGPGTPSYTVTPAFLFRLGKPPDGDVTILDFGEASFASEPQKQCHTPIRLQAPETLFGESVSQPSDIWAFACTVFAIFNNESLFRGFMPDADDILFEIVDALGLLPDPWWNKWEHRAEFYDEDGRKILEGLTEGYRKTRPLAMRVRQMRSSPPAARDAEQLGEEDLAGLQQLLERCLQYKPEDRATAQEILELDWIKKIGANMQVSQSRPRGFGVERRF